MNEFVTYLNTLHNYKAQNSNSYAERNIKSQYYNDIKVNIRICDFLERKLLGDTSQIVVLTGYAGDGKTSVMAQVIDNLTEDGFVDDKQHEYELSNGTKCVCVKDFSELSQTDRKPIFENAINSVSNDKMVFMVANTGPLINTFGEMYDESVSEKAKIELIDLMDENSGETRCIQNIMISVINIANIDNTYFSIEFLDNIINNKLWVECESCAKKSYCHINSNRQLICNNRDKVKRFLKMHYTWLAENGRRLTIRSMAEQLAFMITGGFSCDNIPQIDRYKLMFVNLFFGYIGTRNNNKALNIVAIKEAQNCRYDEKRLRADEILLIRKDYSKVFGVEETKIIKEAADKDAFEEKFNAFVRRAYIFLNINTDDSTIAKDDEDIFSRQFMHYIEVRNGESDNLSPYKVLVRDALSMLYIGTVGNASAIPLTLTRRTGISQNVQLITGWLETKNIQIVLKNADDTNFDKTSNKKNIVLKINKEEIEQRLTLPILDYFDELKNGILSTQIDPQLSHGVESLKAQIQDKVLKDLDEGDAEGFEMIILKNKQSESIQLRIADKKIHMN